MNPEASLARYRSSRALDWWCTWLIIGLGATFLTPGTSLGGEGYWRLLEIMSEDSWGAICVSVGALRLAALIINGRAYEGSPIVRAFGAAMGTALWMEFALAFLDMSIRSGTVSPGLWVNLCFAGCDFHNCLRAGRDIIHARRARERSR